MTAIPPLGTVTALVQLLERHGMAPAIGGSGLAVAIGLAEVANDWDVTVDAPVAAVAAALRDGGLPHRDGTERGGVYATAVRYVIDGGDHEVDLLVGFALRGPRGVERLPTRVCGSWNGLPLGDPAVWARAYELLDRPEKARTLRVWSATQETAHVADRSAQVARSRPFYTACADVYDLLVTDPVEPWVDEVGALVDGGGRHAPRVLDAGCGTGRHAAAMIARGWRVELVDASPELLAIAAARCPGAAVHRADICRMAPTGSFDVVACRGVLNDLVDDRERRDAVRALAGRLRDGGALIVDVRDRDRTRADGVAEHRTVVVPGTRGRVRFTATRTWCGNRLLVREEHELLTAGGRVRDRFGYDFTMRPWARSEIAGALLEAGLTAVTVRPGTGRRGRDRLLVTARRPPVPTVAP